MTHGAPPTLEPTPRRLVEAAIGEVSEHGWHAATSRGITRRAGVNVALITYHFGGKAELLRAALRVVVDGAMLGLQRLLTAPEADVSALLSAADADDDVGRARRFLLAATREAVDDAHLRSLMREVLQAVREVIADALGMPRDDPRVPLVAAALDGLLMHRFIDADMDVDAALRVMRRLLATPHLASPSDTETSA